MWVKTPEQSGWATPRNFLISVHHFYPKISVVLTSIVPWFNPSFIHGKVGAWPWAENQQQHIHIKVDAWIAANTRRYCDRTVDQLAGECFNYISLQAGGMLQPSGCGPAGNVLLIDVIVTRNAGAFMSIQDMELCCQSRHSHSELPRGGSKTAWVAASTV